jgi:hypothetical protein
MLRKIKKYLIFASRCYTYPIGVILISILKRIHMITNRLHTAGLLVLLLACTAPARINAEGVARQHGYLLTTARGALVIAGFATTLLACSEDAQAVTTQATLSSALTCLRLLLKAPLSDAMKQKIQAEIDYLEMIYTTRSGKVVISGETILRILKTIKDIADGFKAAEFVAVWAGFLAATTK